MKTIVSISGGLGSAYALKMCIEKCGRENVIAVFADVKGTGYSHFWSDFPAVEYLLQERFGGESQDTYRFIWQLSHALDIDIERLEDGRSIWSVFGQTRSFLLKVGPRALCKASELLKREMIAGWLEKQNIGEFQMALGMYPLENHRVENARHWWSARLNQPIHVFSPLIDAFEQDKAFVDNCVVSDWLNDLGIEAPAAYSEGFPHNNCRKICVHAGQNQWAELYKLDTEGYLYAAYQENNIRMKRDVNATILKITRDGITIPITLYDFIPMIEKGEYNKRDMGGSCSCFTSNAMTKFLAEAVQQ